MDRQARKGVEAAVAKGRPDLRRLRKSALILRLDALQGAVVALREERDAARAELRDAERDLAEARSEAECFRERVQVLEQLPAQREAVWRLALADIQQKLFAVQEKYDALVAAQSAQTVERPGGLLRLLGLRR